MSDAFAPQPPTPDPALPVATPPSGAPPSEPPLLWSEDLPNAVQSQLPWLWHGYLISGAVTLLTSQWKSGKTTLASILLSRLKTGGQLAGQALAPGKAVVVSEEGPAHWLRRAQKLDFGRHVCWLCRPFRTKPRPDEWRALIDRLAGLRHQHGITLALLDPLSHFLPGHIENDAAALLEALMPLQQLTALGMCVWVNHHPAKGPTPAGQAARGSGALPAYADIILEMDYYTPSDPDDRRRKLRAFSRFEETPRRRVIELTADGTDYLCHGDFFDAEYHQSWQTVQQVLEEAPHPLTRRQILDRWPADLRRPEETTLWKWLERAREKGLVCCAGTGRKNDPFRYWLPGQMDKWQADPLTSLYLAQLEARQPLL